MHVLLLSFQYIQVYIMYKYISNLQVLKVEMETVKLRFLSPTCTYRNSALYTWPKVEEIEWHPQEKVISTLTTPKMRPGRDIAMVFNNGEIDQCREMM